MKSALFKYHLLMIGIVLVGLVVVLSLILSPSVYGSFVEIDPLDSRDAKPSDIAWDMRSYLNQNPTQVDAQEEPDFTNNDRFEQFDESGGEISRDAGSNSIDDSSGGEDPKYLDPEDFALWHVGHDLMSDYSIDDVLSIFLDENATRPERIRAYYSIRWGGTSSSGQEVRQTLLEALEDHVAESSPKVNSLLRVVVSAGPFFGIDNRPIGRQTYQISHQLGQKLTNLVKGDASRSRRAEIASAMQIFSHDREFERLVLLRVAAADSDSTVRFHAVETLRSIGTGNCVDALRQIAHADSDESVRKAAERAITELEGRE